MRKANKTKTPARKHSPIIVYDGNNKKVIQCNIRDITERKIREEALTQTDGASEFKKLPINGKGQQLILRRYALEGLHKSLRFAFCFSLIVDVVIPLN
jgi:hypothetical protein